MQRDLYSTFCYQRGRHILPVARTQKQGLFTRRAADKELCWAVIVITEVDEDDFKKGLQRTEALLVIPYTN